MGRDAQAFLTRTRRPLSEQWHTQDSPVCWRVLKRASWGGLDTAALLSARVEDRMGGRHTWMCSCPRTQCSPSVSPGDQALLWNTTVRYNVVPSIG